MRLREVQRAIWRAVGVVAGFSFVIHLLVLAVPLYSLQVFDRVLASRSADTLAWLSVVAIFAITILALLEWLRSRILIRMSGWLERRLGPSLLAHGFRRSAVEGEGPEARGLEDLAALRSFLTGPGALNLFDAPWMPIYLAVIYLLHPWLGLIATAGAGFLFLMTLATELATRRLLVEASKKSSRLMAAVRADLRGADSMQAMGMVPAAVRRWQMHNEPVLRFQARASDRSSVIQAATRFVRLSIQIVLVGAGAFLVIEREITPGALIAAAIIVSRALAPAELLIGTWRNLIGARDAYRRIARRFAESLPAAGGVRLPAPHGRLAIENVSLLAPGSDRAILQHVRFGLAAGESLGIVGPSGAGKSTLGRVVLGLAHPSAGTVRIDGADLRTWDADLLGRHLGYLPQDARLFAGSVAHNIARLGDPDDGLVLDAATFAGAHEVILALPQGYATEIDPSGGPLAGGQRQLIALARAFYGMPRLVVLDEPNTNLDRDGETALLAALERAKVAGITTLVITHRLSVIAYVDKMLVMHGGRTAMLGPRAEIMAKIGTGVVAPFKRQPLVRADSSQPA